MKPCKEWRGKKTAAGYGVTYRGGGMFYAHRQSYADSAGIAYEDIVGEVRHMCDNRGCYEPTHLETGTHAENMRDMRVRGRACSGETRPMAKLDRDAVEQIRSRYVPRCKVNGTRALGREFGVSHTVVSDIVLGRLWRVDAA